MKKFKPYPMKEFSGTSKITFEKEEIRKKFQKYLYDRLIDGNITLNFYLKHQKIKNLDQSRVNKIMKTINKLNKESANQLMVDIPQQIEAMKNAIDVLDKIQKKPLIQ